VPPRLNRLSASLMMATRDTPTAHEAEPRKTAMKKLALAVLLPYSGLADLQNVGTCT
jgi:hypothetical protein